jgi:hypothetical protein
MPVRAIPRDVPMNAPTAAVDAGQLIDAGRGTSYQRWLVALTALTIAFDGIDNQLMGVAIPTVMREWNVPRGAFAPVISFGSLGMIPRQHVRLQRDDDGGRGRGRHRRARVPAVHDGARARRRDPQRRRARG